MRRAAFATVLFAFVVLGTSPFLASTVLAEESQATWYDLKPDVFGDRVIRPAGDLLTLMAPGRPEDQTAVPVKVTTRLTDGRNIKSVTFVVDENPSPIAAVFTMGPGRKNVEIALNLRFNIGTYFRAVLETDDGQLYMTKRYVKFAGGQAACSAPPTGDPEEIAANMGKMKLAHASLTNQTSTVLRPKAKLEISHPNHTGMALDQQTLLYIPLRMITNIDVHQGDQKVFDMKGSITLSENPVIDFDYRVNGSDKMQVVLKDTNGTKWQSTFPIGQGS